MTDSPLPRTRVAVGTGLHVAFALAGALVLGALGLYLDPLVGWLARQDWLPFGPVLDALARLAVTCPTWGQVVVGLLVGVVAGLALAGQTTAVEVSCDELVVLGGSKRQRVGRAQVGHAVLEGRRLSVRDPSDVDLVSTTVDGDVDTLRRVLVEQGWTVRG